MEETASARRFRALGVDFFVGNEASAARAVIERAHRGEGGYGCFCDVHVLIEAQHDERVRRAIGGAWMVFPDGVPIAWLGRRSGIADADRACGIDVMPLVFDLGRVAGLRHYLFGSTQKTLVGLDRRLRAAYPGVEIVGSFSPPFASIDEIDGLDASQRIREAQPDVVWCGLGAPKQEVWMHRFAGALAPAVVLGVGAAFDFVGGTKPRAPLWMRQRGLEWLYRLAQEPQRLASRYLRTNPEFIGRAALESLRPRRTT